MSEWTEERVAELKRMKAAGLSCSQIASCLGGLSRNAVIGKLHRLGLHGERRPSKPRSAEPRKPRAPRTPHINQTYKRRAIHIVTAGNGATLLYEADQFDMNTRLSPEDIPVEQRKSLMELGSNDCRFPYGDVGENDFFFCGGESVPGHSYCAMHCRVTTGRTFVISDEERQRRRSLGSRMTTYNNKKLRGVAAE